MDEKINSRLVQQYGAEYASCLAKSFFAKKEKINGSEIVHFCDIRQINLFVIRELLKTWEQEAQRYKSPYFDYDSQEVQKAMRRFQNVLSNHIAIAKDHFVPLLQKSITLTIYLILSPYDFYAYILNKDGSLKVTTAYLKNEIKYIQINKAPLELLHQKLVESNTQHAVTGREAFSLLETILEEVNFTPEDVGSYIEAFDKVIPMDMHKLYATEENLSTLMHPKDNAVGVIFIDDPVLEKSSITVAEGYQRTTRLKQRLTINQKFMFTKMLFNGDLNAFNRAIIKIDNLGSMDEAIHYLDSHYPNWNQRSEEYMEFIELLNKRFS